MKTADCVAHNERSIPEVTTLLTNMGFIHNPALLTIGGAA